MRSASSTRFVICRVLFTACLAVTLGFALDVAMSKEPGEPLEAPAARTSPEPDGRELFVREWIPNDPRSHGGDGLGPVFNDSSCVACHNQGGPGGGGPASKNVHIVSRHIVTKSKPKELQLQSVVLHHFGTDSKYASWRAKTAKSASLVRDGFSSSRFFLDRFHQLSQRNTPALFGLGLIDAIKEGAFEEAAAKKYEKFPKVSGRVAREKNGRVGRFGWKAQKASLEDFVLTACAVELGLHVPGHEQPTPPHNPKYKSPGLDMTKSECDALIQYVRSLPKPAEQRSSNSKHAEYLTAGKNLFTTVGCAACHTPKLGEVAGIYGDLLLHDLGPALRDAGSSYGVFPRPSSPEDKPKEGVAKGAKPRKPAVVAVAQEWRTPPLWGVRDSAPYLHDGRAQTLQRAIALHAGEAADSTKMYNDLSAQYKQKLIAFLKSLVAPDASRS